MLKHVYAFCLAIALAGAPFGAASASVLPAGQSVHIVKATLTAAPSSGESALTVSITNTSTKPLTLLSITTQSAKGWMLFYDANMCQGNQTMQYLANIFIPKGHTQQLGYTHQGAMLWRLSTPFKTGGTVLLDFKFAQANGTDETVFPSAKVVPSPRHLRFIMSGMSM